MENLICWLRSVVVRDDLILLAEVCGDGGGLSLVYWPRSAVIWKDSVCWPRLALVWDNCCGDFGPA